MDGIEELYKKIDKEDLWEGTISLKRNEYLKVAGAKDINLYFILSGSLRLYIINELEEHTIRFGYKNNFITALDSFITEEPSELYIQAIKKTELKIIPKNKYINFIKATIDNSLIWDKMLEQLILQQMEREKDILITSPKIRFERVLKRSPQLFQEIPHKYIASYLRMSPETLSRLKRS